MEKTKNKPLKLIDDTKIEKVKAVPKVGKIKKPLLLSMSGKDKMLFARHLAVMLDAGIPLHEALGVFAEEGNSESMRYIVSVAINDLSDGETLNSSIAKFPKLFEPFFINIMRVGEESGSLAASLRYLEIQIKKSQDLSSKVRSALMYPAIVFTGAIVVASYLAFVMLPKLLPLFSTLNVDLPVTTKMLLGSSKWLSTNWEWFLGGVIVWIISTSLLWRIRAVRYASHRFLLVVPVLGSLMREVQMTQFSRILSTLHTSGVHIVDALKITAESLTNLVFRQRLMEIASLVEKGENIGEQLKASPQLFSRTSASMVAVGEKTGKLSESLLSCAEFSEREVDIYTKNLSAMIEPFTLMFVGGIVGFVALSIITPIYKLTQGLSR